MKTLLFFGPVLATVIGLTAPAVAAMPVQVKGSPPVSGLMVAPPTPDADALAAQMRILASDPKNVAALTKAGELTLKLGDPTAAANLFARADDVDPNNATLKADEARVLVHMERPGEALRLFQQAEKMGADPAIFAADEGLAYDLIGQQDRAQRDYRLAIKTDPDDAETLRRYALSLGISGQRQRALDELDPLIRQQDHAGWRDRAFIFAMTGDPDQAKKIATAMLPDQMASGLAPFFDRLAGLSAVDKAFAVHFGELQASPERLADARMTPPLPPLVPESAPVEVAQAVLPLQADKHERRKQKRRKEAKEQVAAVAPQRVAVAATSAPISRPASGTARGGDPAPGFSVAVPSADTQRRIASAAHDAAVPAPSATGSDAARAPASAEPAAQVGQEDRIIAGIESGRATGAASASPAPSAVASSVTPPVNGGSMGAAAAPPAATAPADVAAATAAAAEKARQLEAANLAAVRKAAAEKAAAEAKRKAEQAKKDAAAAAAKKAADDKAAAAKKAADDKAAAEKRAKEKEEKANPSRIWVQVAGGANEDDLDKAWAKVKAKAPEAFKGKTGWSTPLRATNRVLAGPFKTDEAAQDFVNELAKKGLSAFPFTSDKGQKVDKLPVK
jgi:Flp pilus assembly protein TadD